jgi:hypothetical protein
MFNRRLLLHSILKFLPAVEITDVGFVGFVMDFMIANVNEKPPWIEALSSL